MAAPPNDDPLEFDPFAENPAEPAKPQASAAGEVALEFDTSELPPAPPSKEEPAGLDASSLFADEPPAPAPAAPAPKKQKALQIDFNEFLPPEQARGAQRVGAASIASDEFMSKEEREALERAKRVPRESPAQLELAEERQGAVRVVAENWSIWIYFGLGTLALLGLFIGGLMYYGHLQAEKSAKEVEELKKADQVHRQLDEKRAVEVTH